MRPPSSTALQATDAAAAVDAAVRHVRHLLQTERRLLVRLRNAGCNGVPVPLDYVYDVSPTLAEIAAGADGGPPLSLDEFLIGSEPYLVLPLLTGVSLEELLAREFPAGMDERQALEMIRPVVRTLAVLHEPWRHASGRTWHCIYQDLKPANLMIDARGQAILIDLGGCQVVVDGVPVLEGAFTPGYCASRV